VRQDGLFARVGGKPVTTRVSKHRLFVWLTPEVLADSAVITFATEDDYMFGVLHSKIHETWA
jgi:hypothetical protein